MAKRRTSWVFNPVPRLNAQADKSLTELWRTYYRLRAFKEGWTNPTTRELRDATAINGTAYTARLIDRLQDMREAGMLDYSWEEDEKGFNVRIILNDLEPDLPEDATEVPKAMANKELTRELSLYRYFSALAMDTLGSCEKKTTKNLQKLVSLLTRPGVTLEIAKNVAESYWKLQPGRRKGSNISGFCLQFNDLLDDALEEANIERARKRGLQPKKKVSPRQRLLDELEHSKRLGDKISVELIQKQLENMDA